MPFLRALARTGQARAAAKDAGIDWSTAYARRRTHPEFAALWGGALAAHEQFSQQSEEEEIAAIERGAKPPHPNPSPSKGRGAAGEDVHVAAGQVKRVGPGRWSAAKEKIYFETLAATADARMAADAVGISTNAINARKLKHPLFAAKWDAVVRTAQGQIDLYLVEETNKTFDPATLDTGDVEPRVTIDQAIKISQLNRSKRKAEELEPDPFAEQAASMSDDDIHEVKERIIRKLQRLRERDRRDQLEAGWSYAEEYDHMVPPGWMRDPNWTPDEEDSPGAGDEA